MQVKATRNKNVMIKMKQTEYEKLKMFAQKNNTTMSNVIRKSLGLYMGLKGV